MKKKLLEKLLKVQKELPFIKRNTDGYNYKYAPLEVIWEKIKEVITKNGFVVIHSIKKTGVKTVAYCKHGELESFIPFSNENLEPQDRGSEITYYKRYNIVAIFNIQLEGEDDDAQSTEKTGEPFAGNEAKNNPEIRKCDKCGGDMRKKSGQYGDFWGCSNYPKCKNIKKV